MACLSENDLVEYADGLLSPDRTRDVEKHIHACDACRRVLATVAASSPDNSAKALSLLSSKNASTTVTREAAAGGVEHGGVDSPVAELLDLYLRKDAWLRELSATRFVLWLTGLGCLFAIIAPWIAPPEARIPRVAPLVVNGAIFAYEALLYSRLRKGWFSPIVPFISSLVEVSIGFVLLMGVARESPIEALTSPWLMLLGGVVLFSAIRTDPRVCLVTGLVAAAQQVAIYLVVRDRIVEPSMTMFALKPAGMVVRAMACGACGIAGAILSRHFVRRAKEALREIREQDMFGKYVLHEQIGVGGMGQVIRATYCPEGGFVRTVAIKRVRPELSSDPTFSEAFRREAQISSRLAHPNLVQVLDCGKFRGSFVFVMEYVDGLSLAQLLRAQGALSPSVVAYVGGEIATGLAYLHGQDTTDDDGDDGLSPLVHLDLNPPNVLVSRLGEIKIADFGVARTTQRQRSHTFSGKISYAAPEQLGDDVDVDHRADLFALGLTLHEALTGKRVFVAPDSALTGTIAPLPKDVPTKLAEIVMRLLDMDPSKRPMAEEVRDALQALDFELRPAVPSPRIRLKKVMDAIGRPKKSVQEKSGPPS